MVGNGSGNGLANPPCRIGAEFIASAIFVFIDRPHQAGIAFLNDIQEAQAAIAIFFGDGNHQAQIAAGKISLGLFILAKNRFNGTKAFIELTRRLEYQILHAVKLLLHRIDIFNHVIAIGTGFDNSFKLVHFLADALKLFHHRLNPACTQAQFFQKRRNLSAIAANVFDRDLWPR